MLSGRQTSPALQSLSAAPKTQGFPAIGTKKDNGQSLSEDDILILLTFSFQMLLVQIVFESQVWQAMYSSDNTDRG